MRCFDPVWRLNLIAINLKNIHWNKLIQILYGKPFTREVSHEIQMFPDTKFPQTFPDSKFPDTARNREDFLSDSSLRVWQHVSGTKTLACFVMNPKTFALV